MDVGKTNMYSVKSRPKLLSEGKPAEKISPAERHGLVMLYAVTLLVSACFCGCTWFFGSSKFIVILSVALLFFFASFRYVTNAIPAILSLSFLFAAVPVALSNAYIEFGGYISEQGEFGYLTGSTSRITFLWIAFFTVTDATFALAGPARTLIHDRKSQERTFLRAAIFVYVAITVLAMGIMAKFGSPLLGGMGRFEYWQSLPAGLDRIPYLISTATFLTCSAAALLERKDRLRLAVGTSAVSALMLVLLSEKFTGLSTTIMLSAMGYFAVGLIYDQRKPSLARATFFGACTVAFLLLIAGAGYRTLHGYEAGDLVVKVIDRAFGLQGHVWYGVDRLASEGQVLASPSDLLKKSTPEEPTGLVMLMYFVSPAAFVEVMREQGLRFTMGSPAVAVASLGYGGALMYQVVGGAVFGGVLIYLRRAILRLSVWRLIVGLVALRVLGGVLLMGDVFDIYKPLGVVVFCVMVVDSLTTSAQLHPGRNLAGVNLVRQERKELNCQS